MHGVLLWLWLAFVHVLAANESLVADQRLTLAAKWRGVSVRLHGFANAIAHEPIGALAHFPKCTPMKIPPITAVATTNSMAAVNIVA